MLLYIFNSAKEIFGNFSVKYIFSCKTNSFIEFVALLTWQQIAINTFTS